MSLGRGVLGLSAILLTLAACGSHPEAPAAPIAAGEPVPWIATKAAPWTPPPPPTPSPYPTSAPVCKSSQLKVGAMTGGVAAGNQSERFPLTNVGPLCLIGGRPRVFATDPAGLRVELQPGSGTMFGPLVPADIATNEQAYLSFGTSSMCQGGSSTLYRSLAIELPQGGGTLDLGANLASGTCPIGMDDLGVRPPTVIPTPAPSPGTLGVLKAKAELPESAVVGTVLRYTVTLSNPGPAAVSLSPCPSYTELLGYPGNEQLTFRLNCTQIRTIPGGGQVTYRMEFAIPASTPIGPTKFSWHLNVAGDGYSGGGIALRPVSN